MEDWIIKILKDTFSQCYGLQEAVKSEEKSVVKEAISILSKTTGIR